MESTELTVRTGTRPAVVDLTGEVAGFCRDRGDGLVSVFVPHATAGVAIIETGAGSEDDLLAAIGEMLPGTTTGGTGTDRPVTAPITCYPRSSPRASRSRCSADVRRSALGNRSCWSTPTATTQSAAFG